MHSAKVVVSKIERERGFKIVPLFGKGVSQAREPSHRCTDAEVVSLNNRRAYSSRVRASNFDFRYCI